MKRDREKETEKQRAQSQIPCFPVNTIWFHIFGLTNNNSLNTTNWYFFISMYLVSARNTTIHQFSKRKNQCSMHCTDSIFTSWSKDTQHIYNAMKWINSLSKGIFSFSLEFCTNSLILFHDSVSLLFTHFRCYAHSILIHSLTFLRSHTLSSLFFALSLSLPPFISLPMTRHTV